MVVEVRAGEAGVMRAALGEVLGMEGIDARVRLFLWSGGVAEATLPVLDGVRYPSGAQVVVMFLSDRPESGVILGAVDGNLSWRRLGPEAWAQQMRPAIERVMAQAVREPGTVAVTPDCFAGYGDPGEMLTAGCVLLPDGRVFFVPAHGGAPGLVLDPDTPALRAVPWPGTMAENFRGGCLLWDGRVFVAPGPENLVGQAYVYDPALERVEAAGAAVATQCGGCTLLQDGRVLLVRYGGNQPLIYDPAADRLTEAQGRMAGVNGLGAVLPADGRVLLTTVGGGLWVYDPATETVEALPVALPELAAYAGGVLLADGRVLLTPLTAATPACVFDPVSLAAVTAPMPPGDANWRGGLLLPDGRALLLPDASALGAALLFDPASDTLVPVPELAGMAQPVSGGCALPDGRVLFAPGSGRDLVRWDPGCGVGLGRDVVLSGWWNRG